MTTNNKFHAVKTEVDGITFHSIAEARRYVDLCLLVRAGEICNLELQPVFDLQDKFTDAQGRKHRGITYIADFAYTDSDGTRVAEDVKGKSGKGKGTETEAFRIKWKLAIKRYPQIEFRTVTA